MKIGRAIASVRGLADQVVVVDTGSRDRTVEVAKQAGAEVYDIAWDDDFSAGRNLAIELAKGDWILWMNPDEELLPDSGLKVEESLKSDDAFGFVVTIRDQMRADRPEEWSETLDLRLFRKRDNLRYAGRLHPSFPDSVVSALNAQGYRMGVSSLVLWRHAYESVLDENKLRWALRLLDRELKDRPDGLGYLIEKADTLLRLNDPAGHEVMGRAAEVVARSREAERPEANAVQMLLTYLMRAPAEAIRGPLTADDAEQLVKRWFPASPVPTWTVAERAFLRKDYALASELLESLIRMGQTGLYDRSKGFDPSLLKRHAWANLGACYLEMGRLDQAQGCFQYLRNDPESRAQAEQGLAIVESRRRQERP